MGSIPDADKFFSFKKIFLFELELDPGSPNSLRFAAFARLATLDYNGLARSARGVAPPHGALLMAPRLRAPRGFAPV